MPFDGVLDLALGGVVFEVRSSGNSPKRSSLMALKAVLEERSEVNKSRKAGWKSFVLIVIALIIIIFLLLLLASIIIMTIMIMIITKASFVGLSYLDY